MAACCLSLKGGIIRVFLRQAAQVVEVKMININDYTEGYSAGRHEAIAEMQKLIFYEMESRDGDELEMLKEVYSWLDKMDES